MNSLVKLENAAPICTNFKLKLDSPIRVIYKYLKVINENLAFTISGGVVVDVTDYDSEHADSRLGGYSAIGDINQ